MYQDSTKSDTIIEAHSVVCNLLFKLSLPVPLWSPRLMENSLPLSNKFPILDRKHTMSAFELIH